MYVRRYFAMMSKTFLAVIAPERYRDEELTIPQTLLTQAGYSVTIASTQVGTCTGMLGGTVVATHPLEEIDPKTFDALMVVGGYGAVEFLWHNTTLHQLVTEFHHTGKVIGAICVSPVVLANAGILTNKHATVFEMTESLQAFEANNVTYTGDAITIIEGGKLITAQSPDVATAFGEALVTALNTL
jgi:protease I